MTDQSATPASADTGATLLTTQPPTTGDTWTPPDWAKDVPQEHHALLKAKNYKTPADVVNAYANAQKAISADKIPLPKDGVWDAESLKKLGVPEKPEGYQIERPKLPDGMKWDEGFEKVALPAAHQLGLTPKQLNGLMQMYAAYQGEQFKGAALNRQQERTSSEEALRQEFGPQYDARLTQAQRVARFLGPEFVQVLNETGVGNRPEFVKAFAKLGAMMGEDQLKTGQSGGFGMGAEEAKTEIKKLQQHPAFMDKYHVEHKDIIAKLGELHKIAFAEAA